MVLLGVGVGPGLWLGLAAGDPDGLIVGVGCGVVRPAWGDVAPDGVGAVCVRLGAGDCLWPTPAERAPACPGVLATVPVLRLARMTS